MYVHQYRDICREGDTQYQLFEQYYNKDNIVSTKETRTETRGQGNMTEGRKRSKQEGEKTGEGRGQRGYGIRRDDKERKERRYEKT
jgi:hypothetical protein